LTSSDIKLFKTGGQNNKEIWNNEICNKYNNNKF
jgi:hypothetical protein